MQKMEYINLDKWRLLNETLFKAYIDCYNLLVTKKEKEPAHAMVKALSFHGILLKVDEDDYKSFYTIAREIGIYYQDANDQYILGDIAQKYVDGQISYNDYLKYYILNTEFLINGEVVHPFEEILNALKAGPLTADHIVKRCYKCIPESKRAANATDKLTTYIKRAIDAGLIKKEGNNFSIAKDIIITEKAINKSGLDKVAFEGEFVGIGKTKQENIVKKMINRNILPDILDGTSVYLTRNDLNSIANDQNDEYKKYTVNQPLNQILFGPPGTGKTYSTITKALNIIGLLEEKASYTNEEYNDAQELFQNELGKRIEFVTMHQSFSYEDFVQGLKPKKTEDGQGITFDYNNGVFKELCKRADLLRKEFKSGSEEDRLDFEVVYDFSFKSLFEDNEPIAIERGKTKFVVYEFSDKTLWFETSNGTTHPRYTLAKKTLKKIYDSQVNNVIKSGNKGYFDAALEFLLENEKKIKENRQMQSPNQNLNHVIILDEINRANISRVFGELIALIEKDKRNGKLTTTLPSGEPFTVPSNLYIIGTMNTADKSIALVDIALRRRFKFIPLYPDTDLLGAVLKENNFEKSEIDKRVNLLTNLNKIIRTKKSVDFEIGHSYFMENDTLINILNNQVLPLLNEYFMYDLRKVKEIIEKSQKDKEGNNIPKLGITLNQGIWNDRGLLEVLKIEEIDNEEDAFDELAENDTNS